ncbi:21223_t:CDS:2 [Rhizophagus irregularis]|uniref:Uncharacterized protein n=1 Tax=Rhizophagus irregularis (strain DAOM 181602 / DAOM 197198 / MUCL 43194) TaxID=747089 RepID=U9U483_RHIID|nr:21223_t:CDS:2 [Rhizophagus irregularis]
MEEDTSKYLGQDTLISYLREKNYRSSYHEFMDLHLDVIIASSSSFSNWKGLDEFWSFEFLKKAEKLRMDLKEKTKLEHSEIWLVLYWKKFIKEHEELISSQNIDYKEITKKKQMTKNNLEDKRLDSVVRELTIKKVNRASGTTEAYNENLINLYSGGGMDEVMKRLEEKFSPCCKTRRNKQLISIYFNS